MATKDSLNSTYKIINVIAKIKKLTFFIIILGTLLSIWFSQMKWFEITMICIVALMFLLSVSFEVINYQAEQTRIINALEKGFGKKISSSIDSESYYNNNQNPGIKKFNLNIFESIFFTKHVFENKIWLKYVSFAVFFITFIMSLSIASLSLSYLITQVVFSCGLAFEIYRTIFFHFEIRRLYDCFDKVYTSGCESKQKEMLMAYAFQYEKLKSYISLTLNSKTFNKMNGDLSMKWKNYIDSLK